MATVFVLSQILALSIAVVACAAVVVAGGRIIFTEVRWALRRFRRSRRGGRRSRDRA